MLTALAWAGADPHLPEADQTFEGEVHGIPNDVPWWETLGDEGLGNVMTSGLANNYGLDAAWQMARAQDAAAAGSLSPILPRLTVDVQASGAPTAASAFGFGTLPDGLFGERNDVTWSGSGKVNGSMGLDVWGRGLLGYQAARYDAQAAHGDRDASGLQTSAAIAGAWFDWAAAKSQLELINGQVKANADLLAVMEANYKAADATAIDVLQQRQQLASSRALAPQSRAQVASARLRLEAMVPNATLPEPSALPAVPPPPATGRPLDLLASRPDLRAATSRFDASVRRKNASWRGLLPNFSINGSLGWLARDDGEWSTQETWGVGGAVQQPLFVGGATAAQMRQLKFVEQATADQLSQAVRDAIRDVESSLSQDQEFALQVDATAAQVEAARLAYEESRRQYLSGTGAFLSVLTSFNALRGAELSLVSAQRAQLSARIQLHQALGSPWEAQ
jgi:outer membrane protein TolC